MFKNKIPSSSGTSTADQGGLIRDSSTQVQPLIPDAVSYKQGAILKFKKSFYYEDGHYTDRDEMKMDELEIENNKWIKRNLKMKNGLIKWTVKDNGEYTKLRLKSYACKVR